MAGFGSGFVRGFATMQEVQRGREALKLQQQELTLKEKLIQNQMDQQAREWEQKQKEWQAKSGLAQMLAESGPREESVPMTPFNEPADISAQTPTSTNVQVPGTPINQSKLLSYLAQIDPKALMERLMPKESEGFTLAPGQTRFGAGGAPVASLPSVESQSPFTLGPGQQRFDPSGRAIAGLPEKPGDSGFTLGEGQTRFDASGKPIVAVPKTQAGEVPTIENVAGLRKEFTAQSKDFVVVRDAYSRMVAASKTPSAAGDLATIYAFMKMLDPNSVVRETEFATAQNAASVPEQVRALWNRALSGERLSPATRQDFVNQASSLFRATAGRQSQLEDSFRQQAQLMGVDPAKVVIDYIGELRQQQGGQRPTTRKDGVGVAVIAGLREGKMTREQAKAVLTREGGMSPSEADGFLDVLQKATERAGGGR